MTPASDSLRDALLALSTSEQHTLLTQLTEAEAEALLYDWSIWARPCSGPHADGTYGGQVPPPGDWRIWLLLAGRGYGKTRCGSEWVRAQVESGTYGRIALIGATAADVRDTMVEGESGILACSPKATRPEYQPTRRRLYWPHNGAVAMMYSAEEPDRLRGPQHDGGWADELAAWAYQETFDMFLLGLRLGKDPRAVVTTTPRPIPLIKRLLADATTAVTRGNTYENTPNLAPAFVAQVVKRYAGTRLGQQELYAQLLADTPGALWTRDLLEQTRVVKHPPLLRVVVAVDPEAASDEGSAETGIMVCGLGRDGYGYLLEDCSLRGTPDQWGRAAVTAYHKHGADRLCGEVNNGGEMVGHVIKTVDPTVAFKSLHASRGKAARAEPVAALYEQAKAHHVGFFPDLEDQLTSWVAGDKSPDRLDALAWGMTELLLGGTNAHIAVAISSTEEEREQHAHEELARKLQAVAARYLDEHENSPADAGEAVSDNAAALPVLGDADLQLTRLWAATARQLAEQQQERQEAEREQIARLRGILGQLGRYGA